jgi:hypothetical protein
MNPAVNEAGAESEYSNEVTYVPKPGNRYGETK